MGFLLIYYKYLGPCNLASAFLMSAVSSVLILIHLEEGRKAKELKMRSRNGISTSRRTQGRAFLGFIANIQCLSMYRESPKGAKIPSLYQTYINITFISIVQHTASNISTRHRIKHTLTLHLFLLFTTQHHTESWHIKLHFYCSHLHTFLLFWSPHRILAHQHWCALIRQSTAPSLGTEKGVKQVRTQHLRWVTKRCALIRNECLLFS